MAQRPPHPCLHPGCGALVPAGVPRCEKHTQQRQREIDEQRPSSAMRGYGREWRKASARFLRMNPFCECGAEASETDHIIPHRGDPELFWDRRNWQPLCKSCHSAKTMRESVR